MNGRTLILDLSLEKTRGKFLSPHFAIEEFACKDGGDRVLVDLGLIYLLEDLRSAFEAPVRIVSGYRSPEYNAKVGGAKDSQHIYGRAADIQIPGVTPREIASYLETQGHKGGLGIYRTWIHVDTRPIKAGERPARWTKE